MEAFKSTLTLIVRFFFGTPESKINYDRVEVNYLRNKYYQTLREYKFLKIKSEYETKRAKHQKHAPYSGNEY